MSTSLLPLTVPLKIFSAQALSSNTSSDPPNAQAGWRYAKDRYTQSQVPFAFQVQGNTHISL